jgi:N6-adenosine-specific RNA methylase IME4
MVSIKQIKEYWFLVRQEKGKTIYLKSLGQVCLGEAQEELEIYKDHLREIKKFEKVNPMPKGKFDIIYADPPWQYTPAVKNRQIENHYPTMELSDICDLKVPSADDCILFLWGTAPKLPDALEVMKKWKFIYKTNAVWDKKRTGMGYYLRGQHELLLVGTKGKPGVPEAKDRFPSVIESIRTEHSAKPDIVYEMIEKMYPSRSYLELFARRKFGDRWCVWGNEI